MYPGKGPSHLERIAWELHDSLGGSSRMAAAWHGDVSAQYCSVQNQADIPATGDGKYIFFNADGCFALVEANPGPLLWCIMWHGALCQFCRLHGGRFAHGELVNRTPFPISCLN